MIELEDVTLQFGDVSVLDGVTLSAARGEFLALIGPNGAGKTTLLRTINGILEPDEGTVLVDGKPVSERSTKALSRLLATVPQDTHLGFSFTARQVVEMGRTPHRSRLDWSDDSDPVERALERTETTHLADREVGDLSGGERQRVLLARALAQEPDALLLDEPTANLDINHQVQVLDLVDSLVSDGKAAIAAIHDIDLAARYCDKIALLADGQIQAYGAPMDVLETDAVEEAFGIMTGTSTDPVTGMPRVTALEDRGQQTASVHVLGYGTEGAETVRALATAGYEVTVGPVPEGDVTTEVAAALELEAVTVPPFGHPERSTVEDAELLGESDIIVEVGGMASSVGMAVPSQSIEPDIQLQSADSAVPSVRGDGGDVEVVNSLPELIAAVRNQNTTD